MLENRSPFVEFTKIVNKNGPVSMKRFPRLLAFYAKILPTRFLGFIEDSIYKRKLKRYHPKHPPVYILGHWRSGTSFLQSLLGAAPQFVYHTKFQTFFPESFLVTEKAVKQPATYILQNLGLIDSWHNGIAHNFSSLDTSSEIEVSMMNQAKAYSFHWGQIFPKSWNYYFDKYLFWDGIGNEEAKRWKSNVKHLNKKVNYLHPDCQLIVKNPGDTARMKQIHEIYPNAKFVFIHRNPYDVYYSTIKLWKKILGVLSLQEIDMEEIKTAVLYTYKRMHSNYIEHKKHVPKENIVEIPYGDLKNNALKTLQTIYSALDFEGYDEAKRSFRFYLNNISYKPSEYEYLPSDIERINEDWAFVFEHFNYPMWDVNGERMVG